MFTPTQEKRPIWDTLRGMIIRPEEVIVIPELLPSDIYYARVLKKEGRFREAIDYLHTHIAIQKELNEDSTLLESRALLHELLKNKDEIRMMLENAKEYIPMLIDEDRAKEAFPVFRDCIKRDRTFRLEQANHTFSLCMAAYRAGDYRLLLAAASGFTAFFPDFPDTPKLLLRVANTLSNQYHRDREAFGILKYLVTHYPNHESIPDIKRRLMFVSKLQHLDSSYESFGEGL